MAENFLADKPVLELEHFALKDRKLRMLGERVTRFREEILDDAKDQAWIENKDLDSAADQVKVHGKKIRARGQYG